MYRGQSGYVLNKPRGTRSTFRGNTMVCLQDAITWREIKCLWPSVWHAEKNLTGRWMSLRTGSEGSPWENVVLICAGKWQILTGYPKLSRLTYQNIWLLGVYATYSNCNNHTNYYSRVGGEMNMNMTYLKVSVILHVQSNLLSLWSLAP